jgi:hypothetical protein
LARMAVSSASSAVPNRPKTRSTRFLSNAGRLFAALAPDFDPPSSVRRASVLRDIFVSLVGRAGKVKPTAAPPAVGDAAGGYLLGGMPFAPTHSTSGCPIASPFDGSTPRSPDDPGEPAEPDRSGKCWPGGYAAAINSAMPALVASGSDDQAETRAAKSGATEPRFSPTAPVSAPALCEMCVFLVEYG